jgi:hypothetical protein
MASNPPRVNPCQLTPEVHDNVLQTRFNERAIRRKLSHRSRSPREGPSFPLKELPCQAGTSMLPSPMWTIQEEWLT